jgi:dTDP-4-amino-4,6-dideoxygalactose transaminase
MLMPSAHSRDALLSHLRSAGILAVFHYQPLHLSPYGRRLQPAAHCPVTADVSARLVRLPFYTNMEEGDVATVIDAVRGFRVRR